MFENKTECIANVLMTERGTHVLYRNLGLADVDSVGSLMSRRHAKEQVVTYFPDVNINSITIDSATDAGQFVYTITFKD